MRQTFFKISIPLVLLLFSIGIIRIQKAQAHDLGSDLNQQPTVAIPTVTGTATGPYIIVVSDPDEQINVRSGPGTEYPKVGVLLNRQQAPALGRLASGSWVLISYPGAEGGIGWVYGALVELYGDVGIAEVPATPTPLVTPTIDPTLASQFVVQIPPTRLPTFTPPPPLVIPTFPAQTVSPGTAGIPMGFVISGLVILGMFGLILSFLRRR